MGHIPDEKKVVPDEDGGGGGETSTESEVLVPDAQRASVPKSSGLIALWTLLGLVFLFSVFVFVNIKFDMKRQAQA